LHELFIIASVLPTPTTTAVRTINKGIFMATSLQRAPRTYQSDLAAPKRRKHFDLDQAANRTRDLHADTFWQKVTPISSIQKYPSACRVLSRTMRHALFASSIVHGGGKRRMGVMISPFPLCAESDAQPF
jgi:hypothetical protein